MRKQTSALPCFLFLIMFIRTNATAPQTLMREIASSNPYTNAIRAHMLPAHASKKKIKMLTEAMKQNQNPILYLQLIEAYYANNQLNNIIILLEKKPQLKKLIIKHPRIGLIIVKTFAKKGDNKKAMELLIRLNDENPTDQEIAFITAQFYEQRKELKNALEVADKYLNKSVKKSSNFAFLFLKSRLYLKMEDKEKALISINEALKLQPHFDIGWFIFAQLKEKKGELEGAIKGYSNYLELASSKKGNMAQHMLLKAIETKLLKLIFMQIVKKHPTSDQNKMKQYRNKVIELFRHKKYKGALQELDKILSGKEASVDNKLLKIQILSAMHKYKDAARIIKTWIVKNPENSVWFEALHLLYFAGLDAKFIIKTLQEIEKQCPNTLLTSLYLADMLSRTAQHQSAIAYHHKALKLTADPALKTSVIFYLGLLYHETKQFKKMEKILEQGKQLGLNYAPLLNLLAYHQASRKNNLAEAQKLMDIVLKNTNNPHFIDTQALIFYKQGNYKKALVLLEKIAKQEPNDATIIKHLAKTYHKLGKSKKSFAHMQHVVKLTYDKKKKKKYQLLVKSWKPTKNEQKQHHLLCCR